MKPLGKGICLGISLVVANHLCCLLFGGWSDFALALFSAIVFFAISAVLLTSRDLVSLLACGFCGFFVMVFGTLLSINHLFSEHLTSYVGGFWGTMAGLGVAVYLTIKNISLTEFLYQKAELAESEPRNDKLQSKLLWYALFSAGTFSYLVLPEYAGISVLVFCVLQLLFLWFIVPDKKRLFFFIPILILAWNSFYSASAIWRPANFLLVALLYCCMFVRFDFKTDSFGWLINLATGLFAPFLRFAVPFRWMEESTRGKAVLLKKVGIGLLIAIPCGLILIHILSNADMVFSLQMEGISTRFLQSVNGHYLFLALCGVIVGLYVFGMVYHAYLPGKKELECSFSLKGDLVIINIILCFVLLIYTMFVVVQFKYLFAGAELPQGLTYSEYARKGFFELLALTGVNLAAILSVVKLTKGYCGKWYTATKLLCHYLCVVTVILLVSSCYRMILYTNDDGFTRLRLYVLGFLLFEAIGLIVTFFYIAKPRFNIVLIYAAIALCYYMILNLVPADRIIAENQVERYLNGECQDITYVYTLSADAVPALGKLYESGDETIRLEIRDFLERQLHDDIPARWQRYNLSVERARDFLIQWYY